MKIVQAPGAVLGGDGYLEVETADDAAESPAAPWRGPSRRTIRRWTGNFIAHRTRALPKAAWCGPAWSASTNHPQFRNGRHLDAPNPEIHDMELVFGAYEDCDYRWRNPINWCAKPAEAVGEKRRSVAREGSWISNDLRGDWTT